jgi:predicted DsbA family dithiol-disulfide isomerase
MWPRVRARLEGLAEAVGLPIDPPDRNVNSRYALETGELVRDKRGDDAAGAFHHDVSKAFFAERGDINDPDIIVPLAERQGVHAADVASAWNERRYRRTVDDSVRQAHQAGVTGVPAMAFPNHRAIMGMMPPNDLITRLQRG